ncbi:MAG: 3-isopropylmalate dehydratase large subunit [Pyramidobacter sp.]|jgi:3-isopropylmalate dehydratase large subunit
MHATEKILASHAGRSAVSAGEIVNCTVDVAGINDLYLQTLRSFDEIGGEDVHSPQKVVMFLDHYAPASSIQQADNQKQFRRFCDEQHIEALMDVNQGVCHQICVDRGFSRPGRLMVITDSHTTMHGALGAFGTGVGATDMAAILISGKLWFRVPEVIKIFLDGRLPRGVFAKDAVLHVIGELKADYGVYKVVEFCGEAVETMTLSERLTLCNMTTEMGAKTSWIEPDEVTFSHMRSLGITDYQVFHTDPDYVYSAEHHFDVSRLEPQIAEPNSVDNVHPLSHCAGVKIQQAFLGTCTGGRYEDLEVAAQVVKGRKVPRGTRFVVVPASRKVLLQAMRSGVMETLVEAGATFVTPGCAACLGTHEGMLAAGENCISASSRNFPGRMGSSEAHIYLGSPAAVAAAAVAGEIVDPAEFL